MKKYLLPLLLAVSLVLSFFSCSDDDNNGGYKIYKVLVQLAYADDSEMVFPDVDVKLYNSAHDKSYDAKTDAAGLAEFTVPEGVYDVLATDTHVDGGSAIIYNGNKSNVTVSSRWDETAIITLDLVASRSGGIVIKELYVGGCQKDDGSGTYQRDQYVILYNNSSTSISVGDICLGMTFPYNSNSTNNDIDIDIYGPEGWIPGTSAFWTFAKGTSPELKPGEEIVIAFNNAIDNTTEYSQSINFENRDYYALYDPEAGFNHYLFYTLPTVIQPEHYLKAYRISKGNAWSISVSSPAFYIFIPEGTTVEKFTEDAATTTSTGTVCKKVPAEWIVDGIEVFKTDAESNNKRLTPAIDAGFVYLTGKLGYTLYRNVDKKATEALEENKGKLVYSYALGTEADVNGSTDPSGIDAEASIKSGARIIYQDTNNSSGDFHQRSRAALRDR